MPDKPENPSAFPRWAGRAEPYTERGITRVRCYRCGKKPSAHQWQICADDNLFRPVCAKCDVALNKAVLRFMRDPNAAAKIKRYEERTKPDGK